MKYNLLCFQTSARIIIFFNKHYYRVLISLMKENKRYKRLKTVKRISIRQLVPGVLHTVRSAGLRGVAMRSRGGVNYELCNTVMYSCLITVIIATIYRRHASYIYQHNTSLILVYCIKTIPIT